MTNPEFFTKLDSDLEKVGRQISALVINRFILDETRKIVSVNPKVNKPSSFYNLIDSGYAAETVMGIRRLVDVDPDTVSMITILNRLIGHSEQFTRGRHAALWGTASGANMKLDNIDPSMHDGVRKAAQDFFDDLHEKRINESFDRFSAPGSSFIDSKLVVVDKERLLSCAAIVESYADRAIAHNDKRGPEGIPTYQDLDKCIDLLEELYLKYKLLLTASAPSKLLPTWQYDWQEIFYNPWIQK